MSDMKTARSIAPPRAVADAPDGREEASWLQRSQAKPSRLPPGRHTAITRTLYNYSSYKSWAEKVRTSWDAPAEEK
jgi:hypothetical protein